MPGSTSVFYEAGTNLFVPYYRQAAGINVLQALLWKIKQTDSDAATTALETAYKDVEDAFDYYMANYNKDANNKPRPFILAGHSQGSNLLLMLLERRFSDAALRKQLVAAYVIGWSVTDDDMSHYPLSHNSASAAAGRKPDASSHTTRSKIQGIFHKLSLFRPE